MTSDRKTVDALYARLEAEAEASGYHLNPDRAFTRDLVEGLAMNNARYGYMACPCRLADADRQQDLDIICPCDYRDPDLDAHGWCYCALYVSKEVCDGTAQPGPIEERRSPEPGQRPQALAGQTDSTVAGSLSYPVWRCRVCGYLCARDQAPGTCPVCKASKDRFERFM